MRRALRLRSTRTALVASVVVGLALCLIPLLGSPGIESALILGLILPPFVAAAAARLVDAARVAGEPSPITGLLADAVSVALLVLAAPVALLLLNQVRVPTCDPLGGLGFVLLGPAFAVVLAAVVGVAIAAALPRPRLATTLAVCAPIAWALLGLYSFYSTPAVYVYGHFAGYFPGTLYDPDVRIAAPYVTFRALSLVWTLGLSSLLAAFWDDSSLRLGRPSLAAARWLGLGLTLVAIGALGQLYATDLGHGSTAGSIEERLGTRIDAGRCVAVVPREMPRADARRLADDCAFRVEHAERVLGVSQPTPVTAFFFRSADEKRLLMGASNTYVAKPWRNEVYLQVSEWPHPVLFHEVVHVVAGNVGRGPFRVAGSLGGLLPDPSIIEGIAVAVAWDSRDGLTPHQWARAMLDAELAPPLQDVTGLAFMLQPASRAYTLSGSFVRWMLETQGSAAVRRLSVTGDFEEALGRPLSEAEADWHTFLREEVQLPEEASALARMRFERAGIFGQICPHEIANLGGELSGQLAAGDDRGAARTCSQILELDPNQVMARTARIGARARRGEAEEAQRDLEALIGPPAAPRPFIWRARMAIGDGLWLRGQSAEARAIFEALREEPMPADQARQLDVRFIALDQGGQGERAIRGLLAPPPNRTNDAAVSLSHIAALRETRSDGLADYLEARQLMFRQRYHLARARVVRARRRGLPSPRLEVEARRMEGVVRFGSGDAEGAAEVFRAIARDANSAEGARVEAQDWLVRVRRASP